MREPAERLSQVMKERGISCRRLSELTGMTKSSISNYMNGLRAIPLDKVQVMADALNVSASWIIGWTDDPHFVIKKEEPVQKDEPERELFAKLFLTLTPENRKRILDLMQVLVEGQSQNGAPRE